MHSVPVRDIWTGMHGYHVAQKQAQVVSDGLVHADFPIIQLVLVLSGERDADRLFSLLP